MSVGESGDGSLHKVNLTKPKNGTKPLIEMFLEWNFVLSSKVRKAWMLNIFRNLIRITL